MGEAKRRKQLGLTHEDRGIDWTKRKLAATTRERRPKIFIPELIGESLELIAESAAEILKEMDNSKDARNAREGLQHSDFITLRFKSPADLDQGLVVAYGIWLASNGWFGLLMSSPNGYPEIDLIISCSQEVLKNLWHDAWNGDPPQDLFSPVNGVNSSVRRDYLGQPIENYHVPLAAVDGNMKVYCPIVFHKHQPTTPNDQRNFRSLVSSYWDGIGDWRA
jgi:hypothetical protein